MYKLLLCWRYLRTRWIALASIISVTLGVATMIVVNSVMQGFTTEMQDRMHGIISDVVFQSRNFHGMPDAERHMDAIRGVVGEAIEGMSPLVKVPGMLSFQYGGQSYYNQVELVGIDAETQSNVSDFGTYLQHPANRASMSFKLHEGGYDARNHESGAESPRRPQLTRAGWKYRRESSRIQKNKQEIAPSANRDPSESSGLMEDPFAKHRPKENVFDPERDQHPGVVLGMAMISERTVDGVDHFYVVPGDDVVLATWTAAQRPEPTTNRYTVVDLYESKMSEYDSTFVFMPIRELQEMRGMIDPTTGAGLVNAIQIKLRPGFDGEEVRDKLRAAFRPELYKIYTWRDNKAPLLAAVQMEVAILNILLFLIIAVAGFGILAIFYMIVVEKTRDIGILKSLGAPGRGVMGIFLAYGLSLGLIGSGVGTVAGLLFVYNINSIADGLGWLTGRPVFDPSIYYFYKIPVIVEPTTVAWIIAGALGIAIAASILPARRAARLHPVEALRYE